MPFKSQAQRGYMYANHPEIARRWEEHTPKGKKLPERVKEAVTEGWIRRHAEKGMLKRMLAEPTHRLAVETTEAPLYRNISRGYALRDETNGGRRRPPQNLAPGQTIDSLEARAHKRLTAADGISDARDRYFEEDPLKFKRRAAEKDKPAPSEGGKVLPFAASREKGASDALVVLGLEKQALFQFLAPFIPMATSMLGGTALRAGLTRFAGSQLAKKAPQLASWAGRAATAEGIKGMGVDMLGMMGGGAVGEKIVSAFQPNGQNDGR